VATKRRKRVPTEPFDDRPYLEACATVLRQARRARRLSRRALGQRIGLSPSSVECVERAERWTSVPHLLHMAQVVGVPPALLFPEDPPSSLSLLVSQLASCPPQIHALLSAWLSGWAQVSPETLSCLSRHPAPPCPVDGECA
jgi:transcriptional regulator with XRE-family HTH domain